MNMSSGVSYDGHTFSYNISKNAEEENGFPRAGADTEGSGMPKAGAPCGGVKFFSASFFLEALRQIRGISIAILVTVAVTSVAVPLMSAFVNMKYDENGTMIFSDIVCNAFSNMAPYAVLVYIAPLVMICRLFGFLNKRGSSDFYHSLPVKREGMFFMYTLAAMASVAAICLIGLALFAAACALIPNMTYLWQATGWYIAAALVSAFLVTAIVCFSMSICGNLFNALFIAVIMFLVPRMCISVIYGLVTGYAPYVLEGSLALMSADLNLPFSFCGESIMGGGFSANVNAGSLIYTFVLALVYLAAALLAFKFRKSEAAENAFAFRWVQAVARTALAALICCPALYEIFVHTYGKELWSNYETVITVVFLTLGFIAYFVYDLIASKKWRRILKIAPGALIVAAVCALCVFAVIGGIELAKSRQPDASDIEWVSVADASDLGYGAYDDETGRKSYYETKAQSARVTDESVKEMISLQLKKTIAYFDGGQAGTYPGEYSLNVKIKFSGGTIERMILLNEDQYEQWTGAIRTNEDIYKLYMERPADGCVYSLKGYVGDSDASVTDELVDAYWRDVENMGFDNWYALQGAGTGSEYYLKCYINEGASQYYINMPIIAEDTPEAYGCLAETINRAAIENGDIEKLVKYLEKAGDADIGNLESGGQLEIWLQIDLSGGDVSETDARGSVLAENTGAAHTELTEETAGSEYYSWEASNDDGFIYCLWQTDEYSDSGSAESCESFSESLACLKSLGEYIGGLDESCFTDLSGEDGICRLQFGYYEYGYSGSDDGEDEDGEDAYDTDLFGYEYNYASFDIYLPADEYIETITGTLNGLMEDAQE